MDWETRVEHAARLNMQNMEYNLIIIRAPISDEEIKNHTLGSKTEKAPGQDNIDNKQLQELPNCYLNFTANLINSILKILSY